MHPSNARPRPKHYLGIDPSIRSTGIALLSIFETKTERMTLRIALKESGPALLHLQCNTFLNFVGTPPGGISGICIEGASLNSTNRADDMGQIRGAYILSCMQHYWPGALPREIPPNSLKMFFTGSGVASKEQMVEASAASGWNVESDDEADAAGLAELARALADDNMHLTRKQLEAIKKIREIGQSSHTGLAKNKITNI